ncbi:MAG: hypothetical protein GF346_01150 [Candidatus Eisenbacteria bacterium]|nr:hypothetical protein [Candidatus Latescibacterota bacterium]MBD3301036.1 hypothetical protein [Candidatus Eisenbacteria bacterium]
MSGPRVVKGGRTGRGRRIERKTERQRKKLPIRRERTKARLRRDFARRVDSLVADLRRFASLRGADDRIAHLRSCIERLDLCLDEKPQSAPLRRQAHFCRETLARLRDDPDRADRVKLPLPLDDPEQLRLVAKARIRRPASSRTSWN